MVELRQMPPLVVLIVHSYSRRPARETTRALRRRRYQDPSHFEHSEFEFTVLGGILQGDIMEVPGVEAVVSSNGNPSGKCYFLSADV